MVGKFFGPQGYVHRFIIVYRFMDQISHALMCWTKYSIFSIVIMLYHLTVQADVKFEGMVKFVGYGCVFCKRSWVLLHV